MLAPNASLIAANRRQAWALGFLFVVLPAVSVGGGLAIAPLMAFSALIATPFALPQRWPWVVLAAAAWAAASLFWAPAPRVETALKIAAIALLGVLLVAASVRLTSGGRRLVRTCLLAGMIALVALLAVEALFDMPLNRATQPDAETGLLARNPGRGVLVLEAFGVAALGALAFQGAALRFGLGALLLAAMAALSLQFDMEANAVALCAGLLAFAIGYAMPRLAPILAGLGLAGWLLAAPWIIRAASEHLNALVPQLPASWGMRLQIWDYAAARVAEKPLMGWGLDAARTFEAPQQLGDLTYPAIPLHPHSVSLQIWLELGAIGAGLFAAAIAAVGVAVARNLGGDRIAAAVACAGMAAIGSVWNLSYGAWQEWFLCLPFVMSAAVLAMRRNG